MNYKYFALNSNPNKKLSVKQIAINAIIILSNLILLSCIFSIPIATYYNYDKLDSSLEIKNSENELIKPLYQNGLFNNPWPTEYTRAGFGGFLKFAIFEKDKTNLPNDPSELDKTLPVHQLTSSEINDFISVSNNSTLKTIWIGHSTVLINLEGQIILTDPLFSNRASPSQIIGPKRYRHVPITIEDIPRIDFVLISHNHYDHLDYNSVEKLKEKFGDKIRWLVPMELAKWFVSCGINENNIIELNWWESKEFNHLKFTFTPAQHWSGRSLFDKDRSLWGGWIVQGMYRNLYFVGDTGYCSVFEEIGKNYGPFDLSLIPIGAYEPRWFMGRQHINPEEAVKLHVEVKSSKSAGIHWGTFHMAYEYYLSPKEDLSYALEQNNLDQEVFCTMEHGVINVY